MLCRLNEKTLQLSEMTKIGIGKGEVVILFLYFSVHQAILSFVVVVDYVLFVNYMIIILEHCSEYF